MIRGTKITSLQTLGSKYDNGHILGAFMDNGDYYRISTNELIKLFNDNVILEANQKRTYKHLTIKEF
jgi:hypothetical protein